MLVLLSFPHKFSSYALQAGSTGEQKSTNPFDLPFGSDLEADNMVCDLYLYGASRGFMVSSRWDRIELCKGRKLMNPKYQRPI